MDKLEKSFELLQQAVTLMKNALDTDFFEAYIETAENIIDGRVRVLDDRPDAETAQRLTRLYQELLALELEPEAWRKTAQFVLLKGFQGEALQANHQLTPDGIGFLFVFLIEQLQAKAQPLHLTDVAVGTGNLLLTAALALQQAGYHVTSEGVDNDATLLNIAAVTNLLAKETTRFYHQDALQPLMLQPADVTIADLPIGYYPDDENAKNFVSHSTEGHSYAHHLLMEQAMHYTKAGGFGLFLVPTNFMETPQSPLLKKWLTDSVYIQGIIQLPDALFKNEQSQKSILLLQNRGGDAQQAPEVLLVKLHSLKDPQEVARLLNQFKAWKQKNLF